MRTFTRIHRRDEGMAMIAVAMLGTALLLLSTVVFARGLSQFGNTRGDAVWEQALGSAEACLDWALAVVEGDENFTTGEEIPSEMVGSSQERTWAIEAADARADVEVIHTGDGDCVVVKPSNGAFVYGVGYGPERDHAARRVRVVRVDYDQIPYTASWVTQMAFLAGDDLTFRGNPTFLTGYAVGIHSNAFLDIGGSTTADGCVTSSGGAKLTGSFNQPPGCPMPGSQELVVLPSVMARSHWERSQYDLCPDGAVRAGPAHPVWGDTATTVPCEGQTLISDASSGYMGWRFMGCCDPDDWAQWKYDTTASNDGVFYVYQGSADIVSSPGADLVPWEMSLFVEARGVCGSLQGGDIDISGSPDMAPHPTGGNIQFLAGRDIEISGNADFTGLASAYEQIMITGDLDVQEGSFLAAGQCSDGGLVTGSYVGGNATVNNSGPIATELGTTLELLTAVSWTEL